MPNMSSSSSVGRTDIAGDDSICRAIGYGPRALGMPGSNSPVRDEASTKRTGRSPQCLSAPAQCHYLHRQCEGALVTRWHRSHLDEVARDLFASCIANHDQEIVLPGFAQRCVDRSLDTKWRGGRNRRVCLRIEPQMLL